MKTKALLLSGFFLLFMTVLFAQPCPNTNYVTFSTQAEIDSFPVNYPNCTALNSIIISGPDITNLDGLAGLTQVFDLQIRENPLLSSLEGLNNITDTIFALEIYNNPALGSLNGLEGITHIFWQAYIQWNISLVNLEGLNNLATVNELYISGNPSIITLNGLEGLTEITNNFHLDSNDSLISLEGLNNLAIVGDGDHSEIDIGAFYIWSNPSLTSLSGLENLSQVKTMRFYIEDNPSLVSLNGLNGLTYCKASLLLENNDALSALTGLENVEYMKSLSIIDNDALLSLNGLNSLETTNLLIEKNELLSSLTGLDQLSWTSNFSIIDNPNLVTLGNLDSLDFAGSIRIKNNVALTSIEGLDSIDHNELSFVALEDCPNLSFCEVEPICRYFYNGGNGSVFGNAPGCNSMEEINTACRPVSTEEDWPEEVSISVFPNPSKGAFYIEGIQLSNWDIRIRNTMGRWLNQDFRVVNGQIDLSGWPNGVYFLELSHEGQRVVKRLVKK